MGSVRRLMGCSVLFIALALSGCTPKAGSGCKVDGDRRCADGATMLVCQSGSWSAFSCPGPAGCAKHGDGLSCDVAGVAAGSACPKGDEKRRTCSADGKSRLTCEGGSYAARPCVGGCAIEDEHVRCDLGEPEIGAQCNPSKDATVCGRDGKSHIGCDATSHWSVERTCRGPSGCKSLQALERATCDVTLSEVGDPCRVDEASRTVCSVDRRSLLGCKSGTWQVESTCTKGKCVYEDATVDCDPLRGCVMIPKGAACGGT